MPPPRVERRDFRPLPRSFFNRDPRPVARDLLGKVLIRGNRTKISEAARIVEVEAYLGRKDAAAHAFNGMTDRNAVLFGPPGYAYVYFIYGNHYCLNVSCQEAGKGSGVLFRALEPILGEARMARQRGVTVKSPRDLVALTSGPGRLAQAFGITRERDNGCDLTSPSSSLWIAEDGFQPGKIRRTPRIGIQKAAGSLLRFVIAGNPFVSGPKSLR